MVSKILLANPRGFCAGVNYAIDIVNLAYDLYHDTHSIYILNEIVHNKNIVNDYHNKGIKSVSSIDQVEAGAILIFSAHGVPPEYHDIAKGRGIITIDATCPLVRKVHLEALKFARDGYYILYIGHKGHEEAIGVMAECPPDRVTLIETTTEAFAVSPPQTEKLAYLTQTTLSVDETRDIISILETRYPNIQSAKKEDICYATTNRQKAVKELAHQSDLVIVLGSQNSSNSKRLQEAAIKEGTLAYLIDSHEEIQDSWLTGRKTIGLTAGASAPDHLIQAVIRHLQSLYPDLIVSDLDVVAEGTVFALPDISTI